MYCRSISRIGLIFGFIPLALGTKNVLECELQCNVRPLGRSGPDTQIDILPPGGALPGPKIPV